MPMIQAADAADLPLLPARCPARSHRHLQAFLTRSLAARDTQHGVYLEVMDWRVLTGESGIGKSELALNCSAAATG